MDAERDCLGVLVYMKRGALSAVTLAAPDAPTQGVMSTRKRQ